MQITYRYIEKCSASPVIRAMQIKTTMMDYLTPVRKATIKKMRDSSVPSF